ncbi:hypothetical protein [Desulfovibrio gilichinskyi]|uniref:Uncharacterized protein n=1 Tax=Desulfovibrio gilichinskyi TaxID=1519643 RepID=A0A1X7CIY9_9BACT|nr:hypothetical protein [Desulfovibrio gilichinskyi]SME97459.1 hypothetical protein SAMN06295933_0957 [Desulfovibrio gilichinskyi]
MKSLMKACVLSVAMLVLMCGAAGAVDNFNAQGSALVPSILYYYENPDKLNYPYIILTNITGNTVQCRVVIYDGDGNNLTAFSQLIKGGVNWTSTYGISDFEIPAHSSRMFALNKANAMIHTIGYAVIEWKSDDPQLRKALIGGVQLHRKDGPALITNSHFLINNGDPF